jgi:hypothetical protein
MSWSRPPILAAAFAALAALSPAGLADPPTPIRAQPIDDGPFLAALGGKADRFHTYRLRNGGASLIPGGANVLTGADGAPLPEPVRYPLVTRPGAGPEPILVLGNGAYLALYPDAASLALLPGRDLFLARDARAASRRADGRRVGVHVIAGAPLAAGGGDPGAVAIPVILDDGDVRAEGFVLRRHVATRATSRQSPLGRSWGGTDGTVPAGTAIREAPGGAVIATLGDLAVAVHRDEGRAMVKRLRARGDNLLIRYRGEHAVVVGWVEKSVYQAMEPGGALGGVLGGMIGVGDEPRGGRRVALAKDTRLHATPGGPLVGMTWRDLETPRLAEKDGWIKVAIGTQLGPIEVWAPPAPR